MSRRKRLITRTAGRLLHAELAREAVQDPAPVGDAGHRHEHAGLEELLLERLEQVAHEERLARAALAEHLRGHALADLALGVAVFQEQQIRVRVDVDEAGGDDQAGGVDLAPGRPGRHAADVRPERLETARRWGAAAGYRVGEEDVPAAVRRASDGRGADLVILTVLNAATLGMALAAARDGGTILLFGVKPDTLLATDYWQIWRREINLVSSYSATPDLFPRARSTP